MADPEYVAVTNIAIGGVLAFTPGMSVPAPHVAAYGLDKDSDAGPAQVAKAGTKAADIDLTPPVAVYDQAGVLPPPAPTA